MASEQIHAYARKIFTAEARWEEAKQEFKAIRASYVQGLKKGTKDYADQDYKGSQDPHAKKAIGDCAFYANEVQTYAALISAWKDMTDV